jgi:DNA polymerase-3 subunit epsilon
MKLNLKNPLAFFDIEATGLDIINDRIVEIAVIKLLVNGERKVYHKRINPEISIPVEASLIHGISNDDIKDAPTFREVAKELANFLQGCDLAGFNILKFDIPILVESFLRENVEFNPEAKKIVDAQKIFHLMEKRNLTAAYKFYCNKELLNAHTALADTEATIDILSAQVSRYLDQQVLTHDGSVLGTIENDVKALHKLNDVPAIDYAARLTYDANGIPIFNFGKYKGKPVLETLKQDPSYYNWIMQGQFSLDTKRKITKIKMQTLV